MDMDKDMRMDMHMDMDMNLDTCMLIDFECQARLGPARVVCE